MRRPDLVKSSVSFDGEWRLYTMYWRSTPGWAGYVLDIVCREGEQAAYREFRLSWVSPKDALLKYGSSLRMGEIVEAVTSDFLEGRIEKYA